ncbi:hypothetical protein TNCV_3787911 [Trichonephila clavipes]|nr:hypothetical protein TNCV_3787911 [Trichonephila clavipes]
MNLTWRNPPPFNWHVAKNPRLSLQCRRPRDLQMVFARFRSGHLRGYDRCAGGKIFWTAVTFPWDSCLDTKTVCDILIRNGQMDGVGIPDPRGFEATTTNGDLEI